MATVTAAIVRARWPFLTEALINDTLLGLFITEADGTVSLRSSLASMRDDAVTHYAAHKAVMYNQAAANGGLATGPVASASFVHRSEGRAVAASSRTADPLAAELETTLPGRELLLLLVATRRVPGLIQ